MNTQLSIKRFLPYLLCLGLCLGTAGPMDITPSAVAAPSKDKIKLRNAKKDLRKQKVLVRKLRSDLAAALANAPKSPQLEMVPVPAGDLAENPTDAGNGSLYGAVPYDFKIGKYEVSLEEYTAFLNAVGKTDAGEPNGLYNSNMGTSHNIKGIARSGTNGNYVYTVIGSGKRPVTYVSWFDCARFCNWLHNGCPTGLQDASTTERGAYTLDGATTGGLDITVNRGAKYWIPSEDEWYKAAYHDPRNAASGGPPGDDFYWLYPTMSDTVPGNLIGATANQANFFTTVYSVTQLVGYVSTQNYLTDGGSYPGSPSYYGTGDQAGNVWEWIDAVIGSSRAFRGGSWFDSVNTLRATFRFSNNPDSESDFGGFRIASP